MSEPGTTSYTFDAADMNQVISNVNAMTSTLNTTGATDGAKYWLNFIMVNSYARTVFGFEWTR